MSRCGFDGWKTHLDASGHTPSFVGMENFDTWIDLDGNNSATVRRIYGDQVNQFIARDILSGNTVAWYLTDRLGSVRQIADATGAVQDTITYDPYGGILTESNNSVGDRNKYAGYDYDTYAGVYWVHIRWYDPVIAVWITQDPLGLAPDINRTRYVHNMPMNVTDPSGLVSLGLLMDLISKYSHLPWKVQNALLCEAQYFPSYPIDLDYALERQPTLDAFLSRWVFAPAEYANYLKDRGKLSDRLAFVSANTWVDEKNKNYYADETNMFLDKTYGKNVFCCIGSLRSMVEVLKCYKSNSISEIVVSGHGGYVGRGRLRQRYGGVKLSPHDHDTGFGADVFFGPGLVGFQNLNQRQNETWRSCCVGVVLCCNSA